MNSLWPAQLAPAVLPLRLRPPGVGRLAGAGPPHLIRGEERANCQEELVGDGIRILPSHLAERGRGVDCCEAGDIGSRGSDPPAAWASGERQGRAGRLSVHATQRMPQ